MASSMPTNPNVDDIEIIFSAKKLLNDKKYKEQQKKKFSDATCSLLNSNGGRVEFRWEEAEENLVSTTKLDSMTRMLEQSMKSRFGAPILTPSSTQEPLVSFEDRHENMIAIRVSKASLLVTFKYNLYRSTKTQVELIYNIPNTLEIMNRGFVDQPVQLGSHHKTFLKDQDCGFGENEVTQFKLLKSVSSKRVTLADRMIGKSNKFSSYVSAFANHRGGHIYYGLDDDGVIHGENTEKNSEILKKVEKAIKKMIWPDVIGQPKRGEHWEMFFEPVLDEKSNPIPSTFVIVIFIAYCFGGVFTEKPESYEMVEGKVERMSFTTWKEKLQPVGRNKRKREVPSAIKRIALSPAAKKRYRETHNVLTETINNGQWKTFRKRASEFEQKYPDNREVKFVVLAKKVMAYYRQGYFHKASVSLVEFEKCFPQAEQPSVFELLFLFLRIAVARVSGNTDESRAISNQALCIAEDIEPGLCTAALYLIAASVYDDSQNDEGLSPGVLCIKALEHLKYVEDAPVARADLYHIAYITLAAYHLGYNLSGKVIKKDIDKESLKKAKASIMAVNQLVCDGNPLTEYREIWFTLAQSILYIRHAQLEPEGRTNFVKAAFQFAKKAENLAKDSGLVEMVCWAQTIIASCVKALVLAKLRGIK